jgi:hypothetical protein
MLSRSTQRPPPTSSANALAVIAADWVATTLKRSATARTSDRRRARARPRPARQPDTRAIEWVELVWTTLIAVGAATVFWRYAASRAGAVEISESVRSEVLTVERSL